MGFGGLKAGREGVQDPFLVGIRAPAAGSDFSARSYIHESRAAGV